MTFKIQLLRPTEDGACELDHVERPSKWSTHQIILDFLSEMKEDDYIIVTALEDSEPREFGENK